MGWFSRSPVGRDLAWLLLSFCVLIAGVGVLGTGVALALEERNYTDPLAKLIPSLYYVGMALGSLSGRYWLRWLGAVQLFALSAIVGSGLCLGVLLATTPTSWALLRLLQGACLAGIYISVEVALNTATENHKRGRAVALYQVVTYAGMASGQWLVGYLWWGEVAWFISAGMLVALGGVIAWLRVPGRPVGQPPKRVVEVEMPGPEGASTPSANHTGSIRLGLYVAGIAGILLSSFYTVFPVVVHELLKSLPETGNYLAMAMLAALPSLLLVARQADRHGRKPAILQVALTMTGALALLALIDARWMLWVAGLLYSGMVFTVYGLGISDVNDRVKEGAREAAGAWVMLVFSLGGCLGPWLSGWAYAQMGPRGYFAVSAAAIASVLWVALAPSVLMRQRRRQRCTVMAQAGAPSAPNKG